MKIGSYFVVPLCEGTIVRDGGVSFGVLPKSEWSRLMTPDENNGVRFALTCFLVQGHGMNVLIDAGIGDKRSAEQETALAIDRRANLDELLTRVGLTRDGIDIVVLTHLHFSAAGGLTRLDEDGVLVPGFPNARVVIQNGEWERSVHANLRTRGLYDKEDFEPLLWHQKLELINGDEQLLPGLWVRVTSGHTEMHQVVVIESEDDGAIFWGDLVPSVAHLHLNAVSALDLAPIRSMEMKAEWMARAIEGGWVCFFAHDAEVAAALIKGTVRSATGVTHEPLLSPFADAD